ncbi:EamA family transporter [Glutamicibacter protophormiae]|uniref:Inner membrane transporter RhtA n=1 Tax=Glutamicibacter protophormiae TaxID=37930 RepID=A0ABS4XMW5_GLUPR|nr:EamA family transporter [Glutamicibacter protophormiae]MBP2397861.1 inner membrane transporter RhtA [Glutamicibacter protophormiae]GGL86056.1 membrane protein [Glutamicibacter protophormiae]
MTARHTGYSLPPWSMAIAAMLSIQLANALSVGVLREVGPAGTAWLRLCFGVVFLWIISRPAIRSIRRKDLPSLLILGTVTGFMTVFFLGAVERIPLGTAVAIEFLGPLAVAGIMSGNRRALIWPATALVGIILLTEPWSGSFDPIGVGLALAAGACWALYNILTQRVGDRFAGISGLSLTIPIAALATLPVGLPQVINGNLVWWVLPAAAGIALITPVIAFGLEMLALKRMNHTSFGTLLSVEPAFGVLIGLLVLGQAPSTYQAIGVVIVVIAGAAAQWDGARKFSGELTEIAAPTHGPQ